MNWRSVPEAHSVPSLFLQVFDQEQHFLQVTPILLIFRLSTSLFHPPFSTLPSLFPRNFSFPVISFKKASFCFLISRNLCSPEGGKFSAAIRNFRDSSIPFI